MYERTTLETLVHPLSKDEYYVRITDWHSQDDPDDDDILRYNVYAFGIDKHNQTVTMKIIDFESYFFIELPQNWNQSQLDILVDFIIQSDEKYKTLAKSLTEYKFIRAKPFYYFTANEKFRYAKFKFLSRRAENQFINKFRESFTIQSLGIHNYQFKLLETGIDPMIRLIHHRDLEAAGWLKIEKGGFINIIERSTRTAIEIEVSYTMIHKAVDPDGNTLQEIPDIITASFDIEAESSHGDFPVSRKYYQKLARDLISEYTRLRIEKDHDILSTPRGVFQELLTLVFEDDFTNYSTIHHIEYRDDCNNIIDGCKSSLFKFINDTSLIDNLKHDVMSKLINFVSDTNAKLLSYSFVCEIKRLIDNKNTQFQKSPISVANFILGLPFRKYFNSHNVNRAYTIDNIKPDPLVIRFITPSVLTLCESMFDDIYIKRKKTDALGNKLTSETYIEALTNHFDEFFPQLEGDKLIQIGTTFKSYNDEHLYLKHIITLNSCSPIDNNTMIDCEYEGVEYPEKELPKIVGESHKLLFPETPKDQLDTIEKNCMDLLSSGKYNQVNSLAISNKKKYQHIVDKSTVIVEQYNTEAEVILAWTRLIQNTDPDIITGYNIFGFDFKYMMERAEVLGIHEQFSDLGRFKNRSEKLAEKSLCSSAFGDNRLFFIPMKGRVLIDLYKVVQKDHKLSSYGLDYVCEHFMSMHKIDVTPNEIFSLQKGTSDDRRRIAVYCMVDCLLCNRLMDKLQIFMNNIGMANVGSVPVTYLFQRGQGIRVLSLISKVCRLKGYLIEDIDKSKINLDESYEGAIVLDPIRGIYDSPVVVGDFNSLYPNCMISENISHDTSVIHGSKYDNLPDYDYTDITYDEYEYRIKPKTTKTKIKIKTGVKTCRFAQPKDGSKGIVPTILRFLLDARKDTRKKQQKFQKFSFMWNVYEGLQLAYKVFANSVYGISGAKTSKLYFKEIAACTTATGRRLINFSKQFCEKNYHGAECVYGDTDSIFIKFPANDYVHGTKLTGLDAVMRSMMLCTESARLITKKLKSPHNLEFEKAIWWFVLESKKRYSGEYYTKYASPDYYLNSMGNVLKRRDSAPITKHIFGGMTDIIMKQHSIPKAIDFVRDCCNKLRNREYPLEMFVITKTLRGYYKDPDRIAHNVLAQRIGKRDPGNKPQVNDRIAYVYVERPDLVLKPGEKLLQGDIIETLDYVKENNLRIDTNKYLTNQIMKPISQIIDLNGGDMLKTFFEVEIAKARASAAGLVPIHTNAKPCDFLKRIIQDAMNTKNRHVI